jgi:protein-S-isoprenylcysteine O-methyltransferase Ste14
MEQARVARGCSPAVGRGIARCVGYAGLQGRPVRLSPGSQLPWDLLGLLPLVLGAALNVVADQAFRAAKTTVKPFQESAALITDGVYRVSRHPMYLGFVLILLGLAILLGSLTPFLVVPVFAVLMDRVFIVVEERMLAEKFGQAWLDHKVKVRRWV